MIVRVEGDRTLADAAALFVHFERRYAIQTIRAHCHVEQTDTATGVQLYDLDRSEEAMRAVRTRNPHARAKRRDDAA